MWLVASLLLLSMGPSPLLAAPHVTSAELYLSVDDIADVWLNGAPIVTRQPLTMPDKGGIGKVRVDPCLLEPNNLLAVRCTDNQPTAAVVAFLLRMDLSDGSVRWFSSRETERMKGLYVGPPSANEPPGWFLRGFLDRDWEEVESLGTYSTYLSMIEVPEGPKPFYLSTTDTQGKTQIDGERHLFRCFFALEAAPKPDCSATSTPTRRAIPTATATSSPTVTAVPTKTPTPRRVKTATPTATRRPPRATSTFSPIPTATRVPLKPTRTPWVIPPTATPWFTPTATRYVPPPTRTPWPTPTATKYIPPPTRTPWPTWTRTRTPQPTPTPRPPRPTYTPPWKKLGPTPTLRFSGEVMVSGPRHWLPPTATATSTPQPPPRLAVPTATQAPPSDALVFDQLPVAIHVSLADGPGVYTVDLYAQDGTPLLRVFEKRVPSRLEDWVEWDGSLGGRKAPSGQYLFVCRKGERELKRIWVVLKTGR